MMRACGLWAALMVAGVAGAWSLTPAYGDDAVLIGDVTTTQPELLVKPEPLRNIVQNMAICTTQADVELEASAQAAGAGPRYRSTMAGDVKRWEGYFTPAGDGDSTRVVMFSDDGATVKIDGIDCLKNFGVPQLLADLHQSFFVVTPPEKKWVKGKAYFISVRYWNTIYHPEGGDVDGVTMFVFNGGGTVSATAVLP